MVLVAWRQLSASLGELRKTGQGSRDNRLGKAGSNGPSDFWCPSPRPLGQLRACSATLGRRPKCGDHWITSHYSCLAELCLTRGCTRTAPASATQSCELAQLPATGQVCTRTAGYPSPAQRPATSQPTDQYHPATPAAVPGTCILPAASTRRRHMLRLNVER